MKKSLREEVWAKYDGHCAYCGTSLEYKNMQVDHYYPQKNPKYAEVYGNVKINDIENLMPSCRRCNHYKRGDIPETFRRMMRTLHDRVASIYIVKVAIDYGIVKIEPFDGKFYFEREE